jgi:hypothetical protein
MTRARICASLVAVAVAVGTPAVAAARVAAPAGHLHLKVLKLHHPCGKKYLVGSFRLTHLKKGAYQIDASNGVSAGPLLYNGHAKKAAVTVRHVRLKYQFPSTSPQPGTSSIVHAVQGQRQPSNASTVPLNQCS